MNEPQSFILGKKRPSSARPKRINISDNKPPEQLPCVQRNIDNNNTFIATPTNK